MNIFRHLKLEIALAISASNDINSAAQGLTLKPPVSQIIGFSFLLAHWVPPFKYVTKIKCDINQQYLKTVDLHFGKYE